jgi:putative cell wall-binding protein
MKHLKIAALAILTLVAFLGGELRLATRSTTVEPTDAISKAEKQIGSVALAQAAELPMYFIKNEGQVEGSSLYYVEGTPTDIQFDQTGVVFVQKVKSEDDQPAYSTFRMEFVGAHAVTPEPTGEDGPPFSYFLGDQSNWHAAVESTTKLTYRGIWDGIDMTLEGRGGNLKYTFTVAPYADPSQIKLRYDGADVAINNAGELEIATSNNTIVDQAPVADQGVDRPVSVAYDVVHDNNQNYVSFRMGDYDPSLPLTIDPIVVAWANLIGSVDPDEGDLTEYYDGVQGIAVDTTGVYVSGDLEGVLFGSWIPGGTPGFDPTYNGTLAADDDGYVFKFDLDGQGLQYATFLGGSSDDWVETMAIDASGNAFLASATDSSDFPTVSPFQTDNAGNRDAALTKLNATGTALTYSTYVQGSGVDRIFAITVDSSGKPVITGTTTSTQTTFPDINGPDLTQNGGTDDYVGRYNGTNWDFMGFIGGSGTEGADTTHSVVIDEGGSIYVMSDTASTAATFPETAGAFDLVLGGSKDAYIAKLTSAGVFTAVTYLGGSNTDAEGSLVLANGKLYAVGKTLSNKTDFAGNPKAYSFFAAGEGSDNSGGMEGYVIPLATDLSNTAGQGRFFGGTQFDVGNHAVADSAGDIYIAGATASTEAQSFPLLDGPDLTHNGANDGYVAKLDGTTLLKEFSGYIGGSGDDWIYEFVLDSSNSIYASFDTLSDETTLPTGEGFYQVPGMNQAFSSYYDGMVVKLESVDAGVSITQSGGSTNITEGGATDSYTVALASRPTSNVTITLTPNSQQNVNDTSLVFAPDDWADPQTVTVTAVNDATPECTHLGSITHAAASSDVNYNAISISTVTPTITDDEPCTAGVTVTESGGSTNVQEGGPTDTYSVVLNFAPSSNVTITPTPNAQITVAPPSLTFNSGNWSTPQNITVTAVQDGVPECQHVGQITHTATSSDLNYNGIAVAVVNPQITDIVCPGPGVAVSQTDNATTLSEVGPTSDLYSVVLLSQPSANVTVTIAPDQQETTSVSALQFTTSNWNVAQNVTTTAVIDENLECAHTGIITQNAVSTDGTYNGIDVPDITAKITDRCDRVESGSVVGESIVTSQYRFPAVGSAQAAIITRSNEFADAFTGSPLTTAFNATLLMTPTDSLDASVETELTRALASKSSPVFILGGEAAISAQVYDQLLAAGFSNLQRVGGRHRRETAALIALQIIAKQGTATRAIIAEDRFFVDAFGGGAAAGTIGSDGLADVVLLNKRGSPAIDPNINVILSTFPSITSLELIGGPAALASSLDKTLTTAYPHMKSIHRTGGATRFETSAQLAERFFPDPAGAVIANGSSALPVTGLFGALLGSIVAADLEYPLYLVESDSLPEPINTALTENSPTIASLVAIGGTGEISAALFDLIRLIL